jgi:hypothetical protein
MDNRLEPIHSYTVVLTRRGNNGWIPISEPIQADNPASLKDARRIATRFCPLLGAAHIIERNLETGQSLIVEEVIQRERM